MLTVDDIKKLTEVFATKQELAQLREEMASKDDLRKVMTMVEAVYGEVKAIREEQAAHNQQHEDNNREHKEMRKRLDKIESVPVIAH